MCRGVLVAEFNADSGFVEMLRPDDELAIESTGNSRWFRERVQDYVTRVAVVAAGEFKVIRHSAKNSRNDIAQEPDGNRENDNPRTDIPQPR